MDEQVLASWIEAGFAVVDFGHGAWAWTPEGKTLLRPHIKTLFPWALHGKKLERYELAMIEKDARGLIDGRCFAILEGRR